ncbi:MAG: 5-bromo-4-chloroindolyl phosphate hydrolysis family protein [Lachnospiraceae bacterium]|nr:5-bromo-4-chloroindolyl phosphate hydrolysis family protein [Lachnospiraceae bacterium]
MNKKQTGGGGIIAAIVVAVCIIGLFVSRNAAPRLFSFLRWALIIVVIIIALLVALIIFIARKATKKDEKEKKESPTSTSSNMAHLDPEQAEIIRKGREDLLEVRMLSSRIKNFDIRSSLTNVTKTAEKILVTIKERPEKIASSRQFTHYYLPTLREVITKYARVEASGVSTDDMPEKITSYLANVQKALDKQYSNLFDDDKLDMTVDMEAMTIAIKRDGLLDEDDFKKMEEAKEEAEKPVPEPEPQPEPTPQPEVPTEEPMPEPETVERIEGEILDANGHPVEEVIATAVKEDDLVH